VTADPRPPAETAADGGDPYLGRTLGGTYRVVARIGKGATGVVYRARHTLLDQEFAVKVLAPELANDPDVRRRLLLEARSLTLFAHRHAVQVRHCGEDGGALFLAMDLCRGETLASLLEREGPLAEERAARIVLQALEAVEEAHAAGIVHRDLKPSNVMVETTAAPGGARLDRVRVLDFGLARVVGAERAALPGAFASLGGHVVGTVAYMSPEQLRAEEDVDGRSDLFSLGVVLYEMLGGALPWHAASTMSIALKILEKDPPPLPADGPHGVSAPLRAVISRALEKDRERRFQTAAGFRQALDAALGGVAPPPLPPPPTIEVPARRPAGRAVLVAGAVVVAAVGAWFAFGRTEGSEDAGDRAAAEAAAAEGAWNDAISAWSRVVVRGRATGEDYLGRARARNEARDVNARADLDEAARLLGDDPRVSTERGRFLWSVLKPAEPEAAEQSFTKALAASPGFTDARLERARMFLSLGRLAEAERDLEEVARAAPADPRAPLLRAEVALRRHGEAHVRQSTPASPRAEREKAFREAEAAGLAARDLAKAAAALDPDWAEPSDGLSRALTGLAQSTREAGEHDRSRRYLEEAEAAATEAIEKARRKPRHRAQGRSATAYLARRADVFMAGGDFESASKDLEEVLVATPNEPLSLGHAAYAHMQMGRYEDAIREYERLSAISTDVGHQEYHAFSHQRVGVTAASVGDRAKAYEQLSKAIEVYRRVVERVGDDPRHAFRNYLAETYVLRAQVGGEEGRAKDLATAKAEFDAMSRPDGSIVLPDGRPDGETLFRRYDYWTEVGEPRRALDDIRAAIGDEKGKNASFYARRARAALAVARLEAEAGRAPEARALLAEARDAADLTTARVPETAPVALVLRARAWTQEAALETPPSAAALSRAHADLSAALEAATEDRHRAEAHLWTAEAHRVGGDAAKALDAAREAVRIRETERRAGRWTLSADYERRLADALDAASRPDEARAARSRAAEIEAAAKAPPR
jgi:serine/threonine-protein kinase